jgi:prepilin-type N-terminal cleavage/methylation domain-containing protein
MTKTKIRYFTILELMIVIAIVAIAGGGLFWRLSRLIEVKRMETDVARLRGLLLSSRMLAINTKADWQLELQETKGGTSLRLVSLEEPGRQFGCGKLSKLKLRFVELADEKSSGERPSSGARGVQISQTSLQAKKEKARQIAIRFFSTGPVAPFGTLECHREQIKIPEFFHQIEGNILGPIHPDDLKS